MAEPLPGSASSGIDSELDALLDSFEVAWRHQGTPQIADFLPRGNSSELWRREALLELIKVDLEYRWRRYEPGQDTKAPRLQHGHAPPLSATPRLEDYLQAFPELGPAEQLPLNSVLEEYRTRQQWGDRPEQDEYLRRFPRLAVRLRHQLPRIDAEVAAWRARLPVHRLLCPRCRRTVPAPSELLAEVRCPHCRAKIRMSRTEGSGKPAAKKFIGRFELLQRIGGGAFGEVWKATDTQHGGVVAVKIPRPGTTIDEVELKRFLGEGPGVRKLRHPGIVRVYEVGYHECLPYLVADFVEGITLAELTLARRLQVDEALDVVAQLAEALAYAHDQKMVHRDVKPSNVMLTPPRQGEQTGPLGRAVLLDFGLALCCDAMERLTIEGQTLGTVAYMSPEQAAGRLGEIDARSDIYSLGVVLYELLSTRLPFRDDVLRRLAEEAPPPLRQLVPDISEDLEALCHKALGKRPVERFATAAELAHRLRRIQRQLPAARSVRPPHSVWSWLRGRT